jgi:hypothetical protein
VRGGHHHLRVLLADEAVDRGQDGVRAVMIDEVDQGLQVTAGGVALGVVLQLAPGGEQHQLGVRGAASVFQVA